jgi:HD-GYP domain-containing protein (c-di-GMP phosphodiesterase class II)
MDAALSEITSQRGKRFDPDVVDACLRVFHVQGYEIEQ